MESSCIPWNKGKKYESTDHLKGIKKYTGKRCQAHNKLDELLENPIINPKFVKTRACIVCGATGKTLRGKYCNPCRRKQKINKDNQQQS